MIEVATLLELVMVLTILVWSTRIFVTGQINASNDRVVRGTLARILGSIYLGVPLILFMMIFGGKTVTIGTIYMGLAVIATIAAVIYAKDRQSGNQKDLQTQIHKIPNATSVRIWSVAAKHTYVKVQCVCLVVSGCAEGIAEMMYQYRYENQLFLRMRSVDMAIIEAIVLTISPAIVFSAIIPVLLIKRIRMQLPIWADYVLAATATILIVVIYLIIVLIFIEPISSLFKALRIFGSVSIVFLPIGGLGVLSCQRVLNKYIKEIAQPTASCDASRA